MKSSPSLQPALAFLTALERHNNKLWFDANREQYEQARTEFEDFIQSLIGAISKFDDLGLLSAKECIYRINRDLRFSKDKTPYKTTFSASIAPGGRHGVRLGYYIQIAPHNRSMLAGGLYMPSSEQMTAFRRTIAQDAKPFKKIIHAKTFIRDFGELDAGKLATAPKGFPKDHPEIELLRLKQITFAHSFPDAEVISPAFLGNVTPLARTLKPFLRYFDSIVQPA